MNFEKSCKVWEEAIRLMAALVNGLNFEGWDIQKKSNGSTIQNISIQLFGRSRSNVGHISVKSESNKVNWGQFRTEFASTNIAETKKGDYDATNYRSNCPNGYGSDDNDEDCLFLNMLVPDSLQVDEKRPVMIWIHGGAFLTGSGAGNDVPANQVRYQNNN